MARILRVHPHEAEHDRLIARHERRSSQAAIIGRLRHVPDEPLAQSHLGHLGRVDQSRTVAHEQRIREELRLRFEQLLVGHHANEGDHDHVLDEHIETGILE